MANCPISRAILGVENCFRDLFGSFPEGEAILKITDDGKGMQWIQSSPDWASVSHALRVRIDGMVTTCKRFISVVHTSGIVSDKVESWQALVLGSLALCIRELLPIRDSSRNPFLPLIEELTTNTSLPLPPFNPPCNSNIPFADFLVQLFAELALSLMKLASFMIKHQQFRREKPTEKFTQFNGENQAAVVRLKAWCDRIRGCTSSNGSDSRTALPLPEKQITGASTHKYQSIPAHFSRHFQGREGYFTTIDLTFTTSAKRPALVSLYGLPGIGKTQLAMRYCKSRATQYDIILWTEADTAIKIQEALSKHAVNLKLPGAEARRDNDTWLLVYDNLDDVQILRKFWPEKGKGHIVVTSRNPYTASFRACASINVLPLNMEESIKLFYNEIGRSQLPPQNPKIEKLLGDWKGVPLAINQMSSFITRVQMDLDKFVKLYSKSAPQLLQKANLYDEYPHSVASAFATEQLQEEPKAILHAMCFFDPDRIPCEVIQSSFDMDMEDEEPGFNSIVCEWDYLESLEVLIKMSLLTKFENEMSIHRLVQDVVYLFMSKDERQKGFDAVLTVLGQNFPTGTEIPSPDEENLVVASIVWPLAGILFENNRITEALPLLLKSLRIREKLLPPNDPVLGNTYYSIGIFYMEDNQLEKSLEYNLKALEVRQKCDNPDEGPLAFTYGNLGLNYRRMGQLDEASRCMEKSEELWRRSYGTDSDRYAICMYYLGNLRLDQGRIAEARQCHQTSFDIYCKILRHNFKTGLCWHKMATFYRLEDDFCNAESYARKALSIFEKCFDPVPRLARSTYLLSEVLRDNGRICEADEVREEAERLRRGITTLQYEEESSPEAFERLVPYFLR
ncbi:hypothetical protein QBC35DRAFT_550097 [Podospora australis]|uniref:DUF7779 domain-containing protein n=1 Tax=Podospora australis TaxID=1536484 RepID=A0AAN6WL25_9PEZI|nr:hypothetical protein QBC35DRAFT_550097 [Podospora australis]